jgi:hypothetical protein
MPPMFWITTAALAMAPDLDVWAFRLGIPYQAPLGHRGFTHSLAFALVAGATAALLTHWRIGGQRADLCGFFFLPTSPNYTEATGPAGRRTRPISQSSRGRQPRSRVKLARGCPGNTGSAARVPHGFLRPRRGPRLPTRSTTCPRSGRPPSTGSVAITGPACSLRSPRRLTLSQAEPADYATEAAKAGASRGPANPTQASLPTLSTQFWFLA